MSYLLFEVFEVFKRTSQIKFVAAVILRKFKSETNIEMCNKNYFSKFRS